MKHPIKVHFASQVVSYVIASMLIMSPDVAFSTPVISDPLTLQNSGDIHTYLSAAGNDPQRHFSPGTRAS